MAVSFAEEVSLAELPSQGDNPGDSSDSDSDFCKIIRVAVKQLIATSDEEDWSLRWKVHIRAVLQNSLVIHV